MSGNKNWTKFTFSQFFTENKIRYWGFMLGLFKMFLFNFRDISLAAFIAGEIFRNICRSGRAVSVETFLISVFFYLRSVACADNLFFLFLFEYRALCRLFGIKAFWKFPFRSLTSIKGNFFFIVTIANYFPELLYFFVVIHQFFFNSSEFKIWLLFIQILRWSTFNQRRSSRLISAEDRRIV